VVGKIKFLYNNKSFTEVTFIHQSSTITYILTKMCDYEEQVVQCPYNKFHMCLLERMNIKHQQRLQQQKPQQDLWHPQQTDVAEESWDNGNYPTYVPKKRTYGRQQQSQLQSEVEEESWNKDDYPTQQQQSEVQEESWDKDDYPTQQQQSEVQEESWDKDDYPTQQQQSEVQEESWDKDDYPTQQQ
jgi:hypothetical protein